MDGVASRERSDADRGQPGPRPCARRYRHRDLGLMADLGGCAAVARPLTGVVAKAVTKGYHLIALPVSANRLLVRPAGGSTWAAPHRRAAGARGPGRPRG
jgi:NADH dehydrogenase